MLGGEGSEGQLRKSSGKSCEGFNTFPDSCLRGFIETA